MLPKETPVPEGSSNSPKGAKGAAFFICTLRHSSCSLRDFANVRRTFDTLRALSQWTRTAAQNANKSLTAVYRRAYSGPVADKDATGIGVLQLQGAKPSVIDGFFFAQRIGFSPMEGRVRGQQCPLVTCGQYANLARSSTPIGVGMVDSQINHKESPNG